MNTLAKDIKILVADKNPSICRDYVKQLSERGHTALSATSYDQLTAALRGEHFDLLIMDIDFFEKLKAIKKLADTSDIVMMSAVCDQKLFHKALEYGVTFCVLKPIDIDSLTQRIDRSIGRRARTLMPLKTVLFPFSVRE